MLVPDDVARRDSQDHQCGTNEFQHFEKRFNLLVKTSNNLKSLLGVNHFLRGIPARSIFFEQGKFFQTPCIFAPQFQISYFLGKISDLFSRFIPDPLNFSRKFFRPLKTALDCFFFLYVHEFFLYISEFFPVLYSFFMVGVQNMYTFFTHFYARRRKLEFSIVLFSKNDFIGIFLR